MNQPPTNNMRVQRILIVDDETILAWVMQMGLEKLPDCEVLAVYSGEQALQCAKQQSFDLLITDYCMPGIDGITLVTRFRRLYPQTPIVMLTANGNSELRKQAANLSIHTFLNKPVTLAELRRVASEALGNDRTNSDTYTN